jgi:hypothetical protein
MGRLVGVAAAAARRLLGHAIESVKRDDRRQQGMAAVRCDQGRPALVRCDIDEERRRAEGGETVERVEEPRTRGVGGREGEDRKSWANDPRGAMQHFGG